ncbi:hypothetical protein BpHYR1_016982 [Brachionus plicatilis]|uniref:Uncharacterized protein n=1 Tax=Brachionus plicatilis TaxID=10195 RepID=A0A3M7Q6P6_BRAPC|nr:hypothetical protein BpHYR1_016982 [Brachionus plicatilis]
MKLKTHDEKGNFMENFYQKQNLCIQSCILNKLITMNELIFVLKMLRGQAASGPIQFTIYC